MKVETIAIQAGRSIDDHTGAVMPPIHLSTTFQRGNDAELVYSRTDNPNRRSLEQCVAALEGGEDAIAFASGMAAVAGVFQALKHGDHVLLADDTYFGVRELTMNTMSRWGLEHTLVDMTNLEAVKREIQENTRLIWIETPSNPMLKITDIEAISMIAKAENLILGVDGTWATPILQNPLALGADYVAHSSTKYLGGHSDLIGGVVVARKDAELTPAIREIQGISGAVPSAFDCWLLLRGIRTLPLRMQVHCSNALAIAHFLDEHAMVHTVHYPALTSHSGHLIAQKQMSGFGGMLSIQVHGGSEMAAKVASTTRIFAQATSLGGVESLIEHRAPVEGKTTTTPDDLIRISVGLEHIDDLLEDLDSALRDM
jgi:cystathionine gamma-synthase